MAAATAFPAEEGPQPRLPAADAAASPASPDWAGVRRDTYYFLGYQLVAVGVISLWGQDETHYKEDISFKRWWDNVTHPHWDSDTFFINYVTHPYWGAAYYIRARERGLGKRQSFWYSGLLSTIFEFGAEAMVEPPSYQDLIVTPVLGSLLGEFVFAPARERILAAPGPLSTSDRVMLVLTDPLGALDSAVGRLLGLETQVSIGPVRPGDAWTRRSMAAGGTLPPAGLHAPSRVVWGVTLRARW